MPDPNCPICNGTGFKIVERGGLTAAANCSCGVAQRAERLQEAANIPPRYADKSLDNFIVPDHGRNPLASSGLGRVWREVTGFARAYPDVVPQGVLLIGGPGHGKTHLAVGIMRVLLSKGHECVFFDYRHLIDQIRSGWDSASGTSDRAAYRRALDAEVLVLDDLGAHRVVDWVQDTIESIITYRCNNRKPLIATTNLPDADATGPKKQGETPSGIALYKKTLEEYIGMRARSRLFEMCKVIAMPTVADFRIETGDIVRPI